MICIEFLIVFKRLNQETSLKPLFFIKKLPQEKTIISLGFSLLVHSFLQLNFDTKIKS